ncbi:quinolinate synthase NadA [bacterium]|jgi:quinolinate synthetase complex, A subunit|nr:quinolinate synthase NadA [bacterium]MEE0496449.1 quinolinate synthase NadA [Cyanobacteriota bacterium]
MEHIVEKINALKKEKNAVILAHCYQPVEIDLVADYVGDSLKLSQVAAETDADIIVFAGVFFMAQTAKLLSPNKKVLLPQIHAGCRMADMISYKQLKEFKAMHPDIPTVCYVNSTAEVKSECDMCCTSSNAVNIVKSMNEEKILFVPDTYLGKWVEKQLGNVEVITYPGFCPTHLQIRPKDIEEARKAHPNALVLAHPECHMSVSDMADYVGSTTGIMKFAKESDNKSFIIATEQGVVDRLKRDLSDKEIIPVKDNVVCPNMKMTSLEDILEVLETEKNEINVDADIAEKAVKCIDRMLEVSK